MNPCRVFGFLDHLQADNHMPFIKEPLMGLIVEIFSGVSTFSKIYVYLI
jgi:hypothetical protein